MKGNYITAAFQLIKQGSDISSVLDGLKDVLKHKGHMSLYPSILRGLTKKLSSKDFVNVANVTVSSETGVKEQKNKILNTLNEIGSNENFVTKVDKSIIGGYIVSYNNMIYDGSYKSALTKLYRSITK